VLWGNLDERFIYLELPLSEELLEGFDKNTSGKQDCIVRLNGTIVGNIEIIVYTSAEFDREIYTQHWAYEIGEPISLILKEVIRYK